MRTRFALLLVLAIGGLGLFAASPALADPVLEFNQPGNAKDGVAVCNAIADAFAGLTGGAYPYTLTLDTPGGPVGPVTVKNKGGCVSTFAKHQDWTFAAAEHAA